MMKRRHFLASAATAALGASLRGAAAKRPPRILLRGSWQSVNIGDIGHTPGALRVFERHFPEAEITLWPGDLGHGSREMLVKNFPRLKIAQGSLDAAGQPTAPLAKAWADADLLVCGSGSGMGNWHGHVHAFRAATGKPIGVLGLTTDPVSGFGPGRDPEGGTLRSLRERSRRLPPDHLSADWRRVIDAASFFFSRDSISLDYLRSQRVKVPVLELGPDLQLGMHVRDDATAAAYLQRHGLEPGKFICVLPRLRYTPYHRMRGDTQLTPDDRAKDAINARTVASDHAGLRDLIVAYVNQTGHRVLACPEMTYEIALAKEQLVDPLPADVKKNVVWHDRYWLPDEAASVYAQALAVVIIECHSPLIALHNGTPAFHVRNPTDTCKGEMYRDFGAGDWLFEVEEASGAVLWPRLEAILRDPSAAKAKVKAIMAGIESRHRRMIEVVRATVSPLI